jgi:hypothetical protein
MVRTNHRTDIEMFIDEETLGELHAQAKEKFGTQPVGVVLNDPSCCGGVIRIDIMLISEIETLTDLFEVFPATYKNFGLPIFLDNATLEDPIPRMRIMIKSKNPVKFMFENDDFVKKS